MSDSPDKIAYGRLMHHAMRGLIQTVLSDVARDGLPGDHHFFITFDTQQDGVDSPVAAGTLPRGNDHRHPALVRRARRDR
jgi:hypothetical protein